ncbi:aminotransferase class V-fold PLP-dependent enzyme [Novosphingobium terrae]|uniref:aminotransferase class V-fold PLP-dependent enzyme n=1 Tax=Novosphingobium terrae TaxID=2726189 RepID=UPI001F131DE7|nr:aminotransferase class V-fold PLP-dependent enzyme [Novosphingobium terrae]
MTSAMAPLAARLSASPTDTALPNKAAFFPAGITYLDSGSTHPVSTGARAEIDRYLRHRALDPAERDYKLDEDGVRAKFATLVGADVDEIAFTQSTTMGEQLVLAALGLPEPGAHIVTDTLHFFGSFPLYEELTRLGCKVTWLRPKDGRIPIEDIERAVTPNTRLVAVSAVSTFNGFEHDLARITRIAHAHGALVYADIVHAAGCIPIDLHASGVDFAACASYKWLMGDFGLGFLYARRDRLAALKRTQEGYYGISEFQSHAYPLDPPGDTVADYAFAPTAMGHFAYGTYSHMGVAALTWSLDYILTTGVARIQAHAQQLVGHLKQELPRLGYKLATPAEARSPMVTCIYPGARKTLKPRLDAAGIEMTVSDNRFRASVSVFNDMSDIDRLLTALGRA